MLRSPTYFQHPAHEATPKVKAILVQADQVADEVGLDDEVVEGVLVGLGLSRSTFAGVSNRGVSKQIEGAKPTETRNGR